MQCISNSLSQRRESQQTCWPYFYSFLNNEVLIKTAKEIMKREHESSFYYQAKFVFENMTLTQLTRGGLHQIKLMTDNLPS